MFLLNIIFSDKSSIEK